MTIDKNQCTRIHSPLVFAEKASAEYLTNPKENPLKGKKKKKRLGSTVATNIPAL